MPTKQAHTFYSLGSSTETVFPSSLHQGRCNPFLAREEPLHLLQAPQVHFNQNFLAPELLTLGFLLPPPPGQIQYQVIYLPYDSHLSPVLIPKATALTPATLVPTLPLQSSCPG